MTTPPAGLRERKKQATREALREAALRLAVECGPDQVRVEDIAEAAGVSPRTYNNYFASREQAIVSAVTADREARIAAAVAAGPAGAFLDATADIEPPLTAAIAERLGGAEGRTARVLAASVAAAVRITLEDWLQPAGNAEAVGAVGLVVPAGSLPDQLRATLSPLAPAFDAAERRARDGALERARGCTGGRQPQCAGQG
ncbi:TetR/AcrR family transcriptional regulator [Streptomyces tanashiensis]|uniref:TetR/AcrR family transcriptional regulator n=1 Tax=Streptomyces tanashiensis TaxID=67367 RepID=UPI003425E854